MGDEYHWSRALRQSIKRNRRDAHNRYLQLATIRSDGTPAVRTLVMREFVEARDELLMITDQRSEKVSEFAHIPTAEICWYFTHTREQYRFQGKLSLIAADSPCNERRLAMWQSLSDKAQEQFFWAHPGRALSPSGESKILQSTEGPPGTFSLIVFSIDGVDHLTLRGEPQQRVRSLRDEDGEWGCERVNP